MKHIFTTFFTSVKTSLLWINGYGAETEKTDELSLSVMYVFVLYKLFLHVVWSDSWRSLDNVASQRRHIDGFTCLEKGESLYLSVLPKARHLLKDRRETLEEHSPWNLWEADPGLFSSKGVFKCHPSLSQNIPQELIREHTVFRTDLSSNRLKAASI